MDKFMVFKKKDCGPCKLITPVLNRIKKNRDIEFPEYYLEDEGNDILAMSYGVGAVPTIVKIKEDGDITTFTGLNRRSVIEEFLFN